MYVSYIICDFFSVTKHSQTKNMEVDIKRNEQEI